MSYEVNENCSNPYTVSIGALTPKNFFGKPKFLA
jgi:hypothetical protein